MTKEQWLKIAKGAGIAVGGALLTYGSTVLIPSLQELNEPYLLAIAAFLSTAINVARKWLESVSDDPAKKYL